MAAPIFTDLVMDNGDLVRVECPARYCDEFYDAISNAMKRRDEWSPGQFEGCCASSKLLPDDLRDTDINRLYETVREALDRQDDIDRGISWEDWLEIKVSGDNTEPLQTMSEHERQWHSPKAELEVSYCYLRRGVTGDGRLVTVNVNGIIVDFPQSKRLGSLGKTDNERIQFGDRSEVAYVPATPQNIAAIERLLGDMQRLRERIAELMSQEHLQNTLEAAAASLPLIDMTKKKD